MRKINLYRPSLAADPALQELFTELQRTRLALVQAHNNFNYTTEPALVDACIFELGAIEERYNYLLREIKERQGIAAWRPCTEGSGSWL